MERSEIQTIIFRAIDQVNEVLLTEQTLAKESGTILMGLGATLDSMGFVNFIVALEEALVESTGRNLNLVEQLNVVGEGMRKPATVGELSEFICQLLH